MARLEFSVTTPNTIAGGHRSTMLLDKLAWELAATCQGKYNGNVSVENGRIRAGVDFKTKKQVEKAINRIKVLTNPKRIELPQDYYDYPKNIKYHIEED